MKVGVGMAGLSTLLDSYDIHKRYKEGNVTGKEALGEVGISLLQSIAGLAVGAGLVALAPALAVPLGVIGLGILATKAMSVLEDATGVGERMGDSWVDREGLSNSLLNPEDLFGGAGLNKTDVESLSPEQKKHAEFVYSQGGRLNPKDLTIKEQEMFYQKKKQMFIPSDRQWLGRAGHMVESRKKSEPYFARRLGWELPSSGKYSKEQENAWMDYVNATENVLPGSDNFTRWQESELVIRKAIQANRPFSPLEPRTVKQGRAVVAGIQFHQETKPNKPLDLFFQQLTGLSSKGLLWPSEAPFSPQGQSKEFGDRKNVARWMTHWDEQRGDRNWWNDFRNNEPGSRSGLTSAGKDWWERYLFDHPKSSSRDATESWVKHLYSSDNVYQSQSPETLGSLKWLKDFKLNQDKQSFIKKIKSENPQISNSSLIEQLLSQRNKFGDFNEEDFRVSHTITPGSNPNAYDPIAKDYARIQNSRINYAIRQKYGAKDSEALYMAANVQNKADSIPNTLENVHERIIKNYRLHLYDLMRKQTEEASELKESDFESYEQQSEERRKNTAELEQEIRAPFGEYMTREKSKPTTFLDPSPQIFNKKTPYANGFVPAFAQEKRAVLSSPSYAGHRNAVPMRSSVYKNAVINSAEIEVPTSEVYGRMFGSAGAGMKPKNPSETHAILNPAQQKSLGFNTGFIPNFSTEKKPDTSYTPEMALYNPLTQQPVLAFDPKVPYYVNPVNQADKMEETVRTRRMSKFGENLDYAHMDEQELGTLREYTRIMNEKLRPKIEGTGEQVRGLNKTGDFEIKKDLNFNGKFQSVKLQKDLNEKYETKLSPYMLDEYGVPTGSFLVDIGGLSGQDRLSTFESMRKVIKGETGPVKEFHNAKMGANGLPDVTGVASLSAEDRALALASMRSSAKSERIDAARINAAVAQFDNANLGANGLPDVTGVASLSAKDRASALQSMREKNGGDPARLAPNAIEYQALIGKNAVSSPSADSLATHFRYPTREQKQELAELDESYKADKITPTQYQESRAALIAKVSQQPPPLQLSPYQRAVRDEETRLQQAQNAARLTTTSLSLQQLSLISPQPAAKLPTGLEFPKDFMSAPGIDAASPQEKAKRDAEEIEIKKRFVANQFAQSPFFKDRGLISSPESLHLIAQRKHDTLSETQRRMKTFLGRERRLTEATFPKKSDSELFIDYLNKPEHERKKIDHYLENEETAEQRHAKLSKDIQVKTSDGRRRLDFVEHGVRTVLEGNDAREELKKRSASKDKQDAAYMSQFGKLLNGNSNGFIPNFSTEKKPDTSYTPEMALYNPLTQQPVLAFDPKVPYYVNPVNQADKMEETVRTRRMSKFGENLDYAHMDEQELGTLREYTRIMNEKLRPKIEGTGEQVRGLNKTGDFEIKKDLNFNGKFQSVKLQKDLNEKYETKLSPYMLDEYGVPTGSFLVDIGGLSGQDRLSTFESMRKVIKGETGPVKEFHNAKMGANGLPDVTGVASLSAEDRALALASMRSSAKSERIDAARINAAVAQFDNANLGANGLPDVTGVASLSAKDRASALQSMREKNGGDPARLAPNAIEYQALIGKNAVSSPSADSLATHFRYPTREQKQELAELDESYKADKITPTQYQESRAALIAKVSQQPPPLQLSPYQRAVRDEETRLQQAQNAARLTTTSLSLQQLSLISPQPAAKLPTGLEFPKDFMSAPGIDAASPQEKAKRDAEEIEIKKRFVANQFAQSPFFKDRGLISSPESLHLIAQRKHDTLSETQRRMKTFLGRERRLTEATFPKKSDSELFIDYLNKPEHERKKIDHYLENEETAEQRHAKLSKDIQVKTSDGRRRLDFVEHGVRTVLEGNDAREELKKRSASKDKQDAAYMSQFGKLLNGNSNGFIPAGSGKINNYARGYIPNFGMGSVPQGALGQVEAISSAYKKFSQLKKGVEIFGQAQDWMSGAKSGQDALKGAGLGAAELGMTYIPGRVGSVASRGVSIVSRTLDYKKDNISGKELALGAGLDAANLAADVFLPLNVKLMKKTAEIGYAAGNYLGENYGIHEGLSDKLAPMLSDDKESRENRERLESIVAQKEFKEERAAVKVLEEAGVLKDPYFSSGSFDRSAITAPPEKQSDPWNSSISTATKRRYAEGFRPAFVQEKRAVLSSPSYAGHRDAVPMRSNVYKNAVINSAEIEVPASEVYSRMFGPAGANMKPKNSSETHAILNPAQQQSLGFNAGFIPNFSTEQFTAAITEAMKNGIASFAGGMIPNVSHSNTVNINDERSYQGNSDSMMDGILDILQSKFPKEMGKMGPRIAQR